jgi:hypothetical protein
MGNREVGSSQDNVASSFGMAKQDASPARDFQHHGVGRQERVVWSTEVKRR